MAKRDETTLSDKQLEALFAAARAQTPPASPELLARIMADADAELVPPVPARIARRPGLWAGIFAGIGGWPALAGMTTATMAGIWIGFAAPDTLDALAGGVLVPDSSVSTSYELEDLLPGYGDFSGLLEEG